MSTILCLHVHCIIYFSSTLEITGLEINIFPAVLNIHLLLLPFHNRDANLHSGLYSIDYHCILYCRHGTLSKLLPPLQYKLLIIIVLVTTLIAICGYMFGSFIGILFSTSEHAIQILPVIIIPLVLFGGLVVNLKTIPSYSSWAQYLSPIRHTYSALVLDQLSSSRMHNVIQYEEVQDFMGVSG